VDGEYLNSQWPLPLADSIFRDRKISATFCSSLCISGLWCAPILHFSKKFGNTTAVQDVSFNVPRGQVFALLGPNGAGKTTIISLIRGELKPDHGEIYVENIPVLEHLASARACLGTVPQFDAMDQMTVTEHLVLYARIRGVDDVSYNVQQIIRAVGLQTFGKRMAAKLSGGNKRKLTLVRALCLMSW
jgi:ATP-binding cassette subfamily A (ABC1) protein 3